MWRCAACGSELNPPVGICKGCGQPTLLPSNVILAGEDQEHLSARFELSKRTADSIDPSLWNLMAHAEYLIEANAGVSFNIHPESLVSILQDDRLRYLNLHDNLRARAILDYPRELAAKRKGIDMLAFGPDGEKLNFGALNLGTIGL